MHLSDLERTAFLKSKGGEAWQKMDLILTKNTATNVISEKKEVRLVRLITREFIVRLEEKTTH